VGEDLSTKMMTERDNIKWTTKALPLKSLKPGQDWTKKEARLEQNAREKYPTRNTQRSKHPAHAGELSEEVNYAQQERACLLSARRRDHEACARGENKGSLHKNGGEKAPGGRKKHSGWTKKS